MSAAFGEEGRKLVQMKTWKNAFSTWKHYQVNVNVDTLKLPKDCIDDFVSEMQRLPTSYEMESVVLPRVNASRKESYKRPLRISALTKSIHEWKKEHPESALAIAVDNANEVESWVQELTKSAAGRGCRKSGHIKPTSNEVKQRVQREIDEYFKSNAAKMSACACCNPAATVYFFFFFVRKLAHPCSGSTCTSITIHDQ